MSGRVVRLAVDGELPITVEDLVDVEVAGLPVIAALPAMPPATDVAMRERDHARVDALERTLLAHPGSLIEFRVEHRFTPGLYVRTLHITKGSIGTSKIHKVAHPFFLLSGHVSVFIPGGGVTHLRAPVAGVTEPGTRRVVYAHEDSVWVTVHPNADDSEDLELIEERLIERRELEPGKTTHELYQAALAQRRLAGGEGETE